MPYGLQPQAPAWHIRNTLTAYLSEKIFIMTLGSTRISLPLRLVLPATRSRKRLRRGGGLQLRKKCKAEGHHLSDALLQVPDVVLQLLNLETGQLELAPGHPVTNTALSGKHCSSREGMLGLQL